MIDASALEQEVERVYGLFVQHMGCHPKNPDNIRQLILLGVLISGIGTYTEEMIMRRISEHRASKGN